MLHQGRTAASRTGGRRSSTGAGAALTAPAGAHSEEPTVLDHGASGLRATAAASTQQLRMDRHSACRSVGLKWCAPSARPQRPGVGGPVPHRLPRPPATSRPRTDLTFYVRCARR